MIGRARSRRRLPLTPLIDVIFLLLLFFMLSSTFLRFRSVEISPAVPSSGSATQSVAKAALIVLQEDGSLTIDGTPVERAAIGERVATLAQEGTERVIVSAAGSSVQNLVALLEVLEGSAVPIVLAPGRRTGPSEEGAR